MDLVINDLALFTMLHLHRTADEKLKEAECTLKCGSQIN